MVGGDEDHRVVVEACGSHLVQQPPEQGVRVLRLQHVPLEGLVDEPLAARPVLAPVPGVAPAMDRVARGRPAGSAHGPCGSEECTKTSGGRADGRSSAASTRAKPSAASSARRRSTDLADAACRASRAPRCRRTGPRPRCRSRASRGRSPAARRAGRRAAAGARPRSSGRRRARSAARAPAAGASGHRRAGQTSVIGSTTASSWLRRNSVKRLRGWCVEVGRSPGSGSSPVSCAGTASGVLSATVVALRYHVAPAAKRARLGKRSASIEPSPVSVDTGSSSNRTKTIGVEERAGAVDRRRRLAGRQQVRDRRDHEEEEEEDERRGGEER